MVEIQHNSPDAKFPQLLPPHLPQTLLQHAESDVDGFSPSMPPGGHLLGNAAGVLVGVGTGFGMTADKSLDGTHGATVVSQLLAAMLTLDMQHSCPGAKLPQPFPPHFPHADGQQAICFVKGLLAKIPFEQVGSAEGAAGTGGCGGDGGGVG